MTPPTNNTMAGPDLVEIGDLGVDFGRQMVLRNVEMCVCDLAAYTCLSESAVSHQLRRLKDLALVKPRREGQMVYYRLDDDHVAGLLDIALSHVNE